MKERVLVTGASGFIGANLVRRLLHDGYEVHAFVRDGQASWRLADVKHTVHIWPVDIRDRISIESAVSKVEPTHIFHVAAASLYGGKSLTDDEYIDSNIRGTANLLTVLRSLPYASFINTGSSSEYGTRYKPMKENDLCVPESMYAISKLSATNIASLEARLFNKPTVTLRLFSPFGPLDDDRRFMPQIISAALKGTEFVLAHPEARRDYIYIDDVMDAYVCVMQKAVELKGAVFNIGSGEDRSIRDVALAVKNVLHSSMQVRVDSQQEKVIPWRADISSAISQLHWEPKTPFHDGLVQTIEYLKTHTLA